MKYISLFFLLFFSFFAGAQQKKDSYFLNNFVAGTSLTYIWETDNSPYIPEYEDYFWQEYTWNINFGVSLSKSFTAGIQVLNIFTRGTHVDNEHFTVYGAFGQYDAFGKVDTKMSLILEMSVNKGDYCTCGHLDPYRQDNLWYYGIGSGLEFPLTMISEHLFLDLSFYDYLILNKIKTKYNYTQYIVGLNYHFGKKRK